MIRVLFFASLRERLGLGEFELAHRDGVNVEWVKTQLEQECPGWAAAASDIKLLVAINQEMAGDQHTVDDGDEVAFFPPVTGG